jgi:hypothetical protein
MATQDNQISDKRRRLFKALSAAPVVATLRPGQALANASAFQCLSTPPTLADVSKPVYRQGETPADCSGAIGTDCLAFVSRTYWDQNGLQGDNLKFWKDNVGDGSIIVRTDDDLGTLFVVEFTAGYPGTALDGTLGIAAKGQILYVPSQGDAALQELTGKPGHFLLTISPNSDNTGIQAAYAYPQTPQDPLAHSCGTSMGVEATDGFRWIQG